ncbi:hypothetical protein V8J36_04160 [Frigidibacter sp. MR17.14]|uniref:hypothetical protein n=1 Tax=Frigidibacter sp. MR17.14 TaxID=3126509 RepID=UPI003012D4F5
MIRAAPPVLARAGWIGLPLLAAALVVADPPLSDWLRLPDPVRALPWRLTPLLLALGLALTLAWRLARRAGFATSFTVLILAASQLNGLGAGPLDIFDFTLLGMGAVWAGAIAPDAGRDLRLTPLFFAAGALFILAFAHLPVARPVPWFVGQFSMFRVVLLVVILADLLRDEAALERAFTVLVLVATASAVIGLVQFGLAYFGIFYFTLIDPPITAFKPTPLGFVMRASGLCITAQHYSSFMVCALPFALWRWARAWRWRDLAAVVLIGLGLGVSLNFGGIFAGALVVALFPFLRWPRLSIHLALAGLALVAVAYFTGVLQIVYDLSFGDAGIAKGVDQRKTLFQLGLEQVGRSPLVGTGLRGFGESNGNFWHRPVHNLFGQAATELGLLAPLIFIGIWVRLTLDLAMRMLHPPAGGGPWPKLMLVTLLSLLMLAQSEPNLEQSNLWIMLTLAQAAVLARPGGGAALRRSPPAPRRP